MSLRWRDRRKQLFGRQAKRGPAPGELRRDWAAPRRGAGIRLVWTPLMALAVISLLALAALRVSILRARYTLGATLQRETATQLGFARPGRVIDLGREASGR